MRTRLGLAVRSHVAEAVCGELATDDVDRLSLVVHVLLEAGTEVDENGVVPGVSGVDGRAAREGGDGVVAGTANDAAVVVLDDDLHQIEIHARIQLAVDLLHPAALHLVVVVVVGLVARDVDVLWIGSIEYLGLVVETRDNVGGGMARAHQHGVIGREDGGGCHTAHSSGDGGGCHHFIKVIFVYRYHLGSILTVDVAPDEHVVVAELVGAAEVGAVDGESIDGGMRRSGLAAQEVATHLVVGGKGVDQLAPEFLVLLVPVIIPLRAPVDVEVPHHVEVDKHEGQVDEDLLCRQLEGRLDATDKEGGKEGDVSENAYEMHIGTAHGTTRGAGYTAGDCLRQG